MKKYCFALAPFLLFFLGACKFSTDSPAKVISSLGNPKTFEVSGLTRLEKTNAVSLSWINPSVPNIKGILITYTDQAGNLRDKRFSSGTQSADISGLVAGQNTPLKFRSLC